jgi:hypothetical protein
VVQATSAYLCGNGRIPGMLRALKRHLPGEVIVWAMKLDERIHTMLKAHVLQGGFCKAS